MSDPAPSEPTRRLVLRPGVQLLRRDDHHLQVGVDPPARVVVRDDADVRRTLEDLRTRRHPAPRTAAGERLLRELTGADLLVDAALLDATVLEAASNGVGRDCVTAVFAQFGSGAPARLRSRAEAHVVVEAPPPVLDLATRLLRAAGVGAGADPGQGPGVSLTVAVGEVSRDRFDDAVRGGRPHLVVCGGPTSITLGPFVVPGRTACLRCVDAHRAEQDPRRTLMVEQAARLSRAGTGPRDPVLLSLAAAWAVRDLISFVDGDRPSTWSASVTLGPDLVVDRQEWRRHPGCGCAWDTGLAVGQG